MRLDSGLWRAAAAALAVSWLAGAAGRTVLAVNVLDGDGAFNDIRREQARPPLVEVLDDEGHPVAGAKVVFQLPAMGAGGTFRDGGRTLIATTPPSRCR